MTTELSVTVTTPTTLKQLRQELEKANDKNRELENEYTWIKRQYLCLEQDDITIRQNNKKLKINNLKYNFHGGSFRDSFENLKAEGFSLYLDYIHYDYRNRPHTLMLIERELTKHFSIEEVSSIKDFTLFIETHENFDERLYNKLAYIPYMSNTKGLSLQLLIFQQLVMNKDDYKHEKVFDLITGCGSLFSNVLRDLKNANIKVPSTNNEDWD